MSRLLDKLKYINTESSSIIDFSSTQWERFLTIEGEKAFELGVNCDTCGYFFERLSGANRSSMAPSEISDRLRKGINKVDLPFVEDISNIIPVGEYITSLIEINPKIIQLGSQNDYFVKEQVDVWGIDPFWGLPHSPKIEYYRGETKVISNDEMFFEFIIPITPKNWLDSDTISYYEELINKNERPTALSLSVLDVRQPADWEGELKYTKHYCLSHYLIDGHHKVNSASKQGKPITLLSFLAVKECIADKKELEFLYNLI